MTNGDRIRNMSDEELAELLDAAWNLVDCRKCKQPRNPKGGCIAACRKEYLRWVKTEV